MVLHGGSGDGAKNKATKTTVKHASNTPATTALAAGLREAQKEKQASAQKVAVSLDDLSDDDDETSDLCRACNGGRPKEVRRVLSSGVDPNVVGSQGMTPLYIASQAGKRELVLMLLEGRADPALACFGGATPLYVACARNHADVVKALLGAGACLPMPRPSLGSAAVLGAGSCLPRPRPLGGRPLLRPRPRPRMPKRASDTRRSGAHGTPSGGTWTDLGKSAA